MCPKPGRVCELSHMCVRVKCESSSLSSWTAITDRPTDSPRPGKFRDQFSLFPSNLDFMLFSVINYFAPALTYKTYSLKKSVNSSEKGVNHKQDKIFAALLTNITHISTL